MQPIFLTQGARERSDPVRDDAFFESIRDASDVRMRKKSGVRASGAAWPTTPDRTRSSRSGGARGRSNHAGRGVSS